jgi:tetratricopeptide (TPR) repeat protein
VREQENLMIRAFVLSSVGLLWLQAGQETKPPADEYKERLAKMQEGLAEEHYKIGEYLYGTAMHRWARDEYRKAIAISPDHEGARKRLGYVKKDAEWEIDPDASVEIENKKKAEEAAKVKVELDKRIEKLGKTMARQWVDLGTFCEKASLKAEAEAAWKMAVEFDPLQGDARRKLGYVRQGKEGPWLSKFEAALRKQMKEGIAKAPVGQPMKEETDVEKDMGWKHEKRKSDHFIIEVQGKNQDWLKEEIKHGEHAYAMFHKLFDQKEELFQQPYDMIFVLDKAAHEKYVDKYHHGDATHREFVKKKCGGMGGYPRQEFILGGSSNVHDFVIHHTAQDLVSALAGQRRHWILEGMAYHFTKVMLGTAINGCVNLAGTGADKTAGRDYSNAEDWPLIIRTWIKESKDPPILEVFKCRDLAEFSGEEVVKAWSLVDFLVTEHREKLMAFLAKIRGQKDDEDEKALQEVFGWTLDDFDVRWKTYARASY